MSAGNYDFYDDNVEDENGDDDDDDDEYDDDVDGTILKILICLTPGFKLTNETVVILLSLAYALYTVSEHLQIHAKKASKGEPYSVPACYKVSLYLSQAAKAADMADTIYGIPIPCT